MLDKIKISIFGEVIYDAYEVKHVYMSLNSKMTTHICADHF